MRMALLFMMCLSATSLKMGVMDSFLGCTSDGLLQRSDGALILRIGSPRQARISKALVSANCRLMQNLVMTVVDAMNER